MRVRLVSLAAVLVMSSVGTAALAQQSSSGSDMAKKSQPTAMTQDKLKQSLEKAGFTNVRVVDATYMVHARSSDGDNVIMYIDPPSAGSASASSGSSTSGSSSGSGSSGTSSSKK